MNSERELGERLKRIAENVRFTHYVVCRFCHSPVILLGNEAQGTRTRIRCETCQGVMDFDPAAVRQFAP